MTPYTDYEEWCQACFEAGLAGPYKTTGVPRNSYQFIEPPRGGTAALWNGETNEGIIFEQYVPKETKR